MYRQVVNLKAAKALITIPCSLLARAEEMIEWYGTPLTISDATVLVGNPVVNCSWRWDLWATLAVPGCER